jgi:hypothetical protein
VTSVSVDQFSSIREDSRILAYLNITTRVLMPGIHKSWKKRGGCDAEQEKSEKNPGSGGRQ